MSGKLHCAAVDIGATNGRGVVGAWRAERLELAASLLSGLGRGIALVGFGISLLNMPLVAAEPTVTREQIERDLTIDLKLESPRKISVGEKVKVKAVLRNTSSNTYRIIDLHPYGSSYTFFTAEIDTGTRVYKLDAEESFSLPQLCIVLGVKRKRVLTEIKPSDNFSIMEGICQPTEVLDFQEAGRVKLFAHFRYRAIKYENDKDEDPDLEGIVSIPDFEIISKPVEFDVERPLDLVLNATSSISVNVKTKISDVFTVSLVNRSSLPLEFPFPEDSFLSVSPMPKNLRDGYKIRHFSDFGPESFGQEYRIENSGFIKTIIVQPGASVVLLEKRPSASEGGLTDTMETPIYNRVNSGSVKVRASFIYSVEKSYRSIKSNPITVNFVKEPIRPGDSPLGR